MPRFQATRRTSLLSTRLRSAFLEAFNANVTSNKSSLLEKDDINGLDLNAVARRVQMDIRRATGRYCPLHQVLASIHDIGCPVEGEHCTKRLLWIVIERLEILDHKALTLLSSLEDHVHSGHTTKSQTPRAARILVTSPSPAVTDVSFVHSSMSTRRLARNIPALHCQLIMPPTFSWSSNITAGSPPGLTPTLDFSPFSVSIGSFSSGIYARSPITPIDQIVRTPLSPPKLPRILPPPPRTWAHLNSLARKDEMSPVGSPGLPLTPYVLGSSQASGRPSLGRLQIPETFTASKSPSGGPHISPSALSPFDLAKARSGTVSSTAPEGYRPTLSRTNSSSLTRAALLRSSRPGLVRSCSLASQFWDLGARHERTISPTSPFGNQLPVSPIGGQPLASPFTIHSELVDGEYFRF